jgi:hypothetical protein
MLHSVLQGCARGSCPHPARVCACPCAAPKITVRAAARNGVARRACSMDDAVQEVPMYRWNPFTSKRSAGVFAGLAGMIALGAVAACADPSAPARPTASHPIIIIGGRPVVFNVLLRGIGNPDTKPPTAVEGHLQLRIYETEAGLVTRWQAVIVNPECESSVLLGGAIYLIQDSEDFPNPEEEGLLPLFPPQSTLGCGETVLEGAVPTSGALATRLAEDPGSFSAVFFLDGGGALAGTLQLGGPDTSPTR